MVNCFVPVEVLSGREEVERARAESRQQLVRSFPLVPAFLEHGNVGLGRCEWPLQGQTGRPLGEQNLAE